MQNKPNFPDDQMNVSPVITREYKNKSGWKLGENKANQSQFPKSPNECKLTYNKGLQKKRRFRSPGKQSQNKANLPEGKIDVKCVVTKDYEEKCG